MIRNNFFILITFIFINYIFLSSNRVDADEAKSIGILPICNTDTEYFNILGLKCESVPTSPLGFSLSNQETFPNHGYLNTSYDCSGSYRREWNSLTTSASQIPWYNLTCTDCSDSNMASDQTHTVCQPCLSPAIYNSTTKSCSCPSGYAVIDRDASGTLMLNQTCLKCEQTNQTYPNDVTKCLVCHSGTHLEYLNEPIRNSIRSLDTGSSCANSCPSGETWSEISKSCLNTDLYTQLLTTFPLENLQYQYLKENFYRVAIYCQLYQDIEACNHLANLCVAQDYETSQGSCAKFKQLHDAILSSTSSSNYVHSISNWVPSFPFLWFSMNENNDILGFNSENLHFDVDVPNFMTFKLFKYSLNGTYLGNETLTSQLSTLCDVEPNLASQALRFSHNVNIKCNFNVFELFPKQNPRYNSNTFWKHNFNQDGIFYSLFIVRPSTNEMYPIPIYVHNSINNYGRASLSDAQLYTRFFLFENIIGTTREPVIEQSYVKFASKFQLIFELRSSQNIYVPYLRVEYTRRQWNQLDSRISRSENLNLTTTSITNDDINYPTIEWETLYYTNHWLHHILFISFVIIFCVLGLLLAVFELFLFLKKRRNGGGLDLEVAFEGIIYACKNMSNAIFVVLFLQGIFWFWFYKNQVGALVLLPYGIDIIPYYIALAIAFVLKTVEIVLRTYSQTTNDVFFIDWEKTRGKIIENTGRSISGNAPISIWRTIYVARAWKKLSLKRQVSLEFTLLATLFFIVGIRLIDLSSVLPNWSLNFGAMLEVFNIKFHPILRFSVFSMIYILIWIVSYAFKKFFWFRFIHNPITQFIDFCSVANISVIILTEKYFGYYIHGESVHQHSDTNMKEFNHNLHMEREDAVLRRGLIPDSAKQDQVFQLYINEDFRNMYQQKLLIPIQEERIKQKNSYNLLGKVKITNAHEQSQTAGITIGFEPQKKNQSDQIRLWKFLNPNWQRAPVDSLYDAYTDLNEHFKSFFNSLRINQQNIFDMNLLLRLGVPPNLKYVKDTVLFIDNQSAFMRGLLWNMEKTFVVFNILSFAIFDLILIQIPNITSVQSSFLSIFIVYILNALLFLMRKYLSHWNTANKTLLDQRFL